MKIIMNELYQFNKLSEQELLYIEMLSKFSTKGVLDSEKYNPASDILIGQIIENTGVMSGDERARFGRLIEEEDNKWKRAGYLFSGLALSSLIWTFYKTSIRERIFGRMMKLTMLSLLLTCSDFYSQYKKRQENYDQLFLITKLRLYYTKIYNQQ